MKTVVRTKYGGPDVIQLRDEDVPVPKDNEVLVRVRAASINKVDKYDLHPPLMIRLIARGGLLKPKNPRLGADLSGTVEAVGKGVSRFRPGDEVFGCGRGSLAEYSIAREDLLALKPANLSFAEAASLPIAGITALQGLRWSDVKAGQKVLVNGASGGVGTFTVQLAASLGAEVTAVCSAGNLENARSMGASRAIDYSKEDVTKGGERYDQILAVHGYHSLLSYRRILARDGTYDMIGSTNPIRGLMEVMVLRRLVSRKGRKMGFMGMAKINVDDLTTLKNLAEEGKVKPFIDRRFSLSESAEAFRYFEEGHARGKVVIEV